MLRSVGLARRVSLARHARFAPLRRTILLEIFLFDFENGKDAATVLFSFMLIGQCTFWVAAKGQPPRRSRAGQKSWYPREFNEDVRAGYERKRQEYRQLRKTV